VPAFSAGWRPAGVCHVSGCRCFARYLARSRFGRARACLTSNRIWWFQTGSEVDAIATDLVPQLQKHTEQLTNVYALIDKMHDHLEHVKESVDKMEARLEGAEATHAGALSKTWRYHDPPSCCPTSWISCTRCHSMRAGAHVSAYGRDLLRSLGQHCSSLTGNVKAATAPENVKIVSVDEFFASLKV
jgi:hypothetical protein